MKSLTTQLAQQFREAFLTRDFPVGTSFKLQLEAVNWQQATTKVANFNTIALLVFHIDYYLAGVLKVLKGGPLEIHDTYSFDLPEIRTEADWQQLLSKFWKNAESFADAVAQMPDEQLHLPFIDGKYGNYFKNITSMLEHSYYHLGQIVLIKKLLFEKADK